MVLGLSSSVDGARLRHLHREGTPDEIRNDPAVRAAYLGDDEAVEGTSTRATTTEAAEAIERRAALRRESRRARTRRSRRSSTCASTCREGSVVAVLGANGAGKSTLARAVSGLVPPFGGTRHVRRRGHHEVPHPHRIRRAGLVHIPEGRGIFPGLSVQENLRMAVRRVGTADQRKAAIDHAYEMFPRPRRTPRASGPARCRVASSRCSRSPARWRCRRRLIIADEMSLGLAPLIVDFVFESIERASETRRDHRAHRAVHPPGARARERVRDPASRGRWRGPGPSENARQEVLDRYLGESADAMS